MKKTFLIALLTIIFALTMTPDSTHAKVKEIRQLNKEYVIKKHGKKMLGIKIVAVGQEWNEFANTMNDDLFKGKKKSTLQLTVEYHNYGMNKFLPSCYNFNVYDKNGFAAKQSSYQDGSEKVTKGKSGETTTWVFMKKPVKASQKVTIEYSDEDDNIPGVATFNLPVKL